MSDPDSNDEYVEDVFESIEPETTDNAYYGFLNVSKNASTEDITAAYKKLARMFHPDKHQDPEKRAKAEQMFSKLKHAHEVLTDPHKRAKYDCLGEKGIAEQAWEVVSRVKTPQEIREEYESIAQARAERRRQQLTNPTSSVSMTVNATDLFDRYLYEPEYDEYIESGLPELEVSKLSIDQSIQAPLSSRDTCTLSGNVHTSNGNGGGGLKCALRRITGDTGWMEAELGVDEGKVLSSSAKFYRKLTERNFVNMSGTLQFSPRGLHPGLEASIGTHLDRHTLGYLRYNTNWLVMDSEDRVLLAENGSGMCTTVVRNTERSNTTVSLQFGIPSTYLILAQTFKFDEPKRTARFALKLGTFGLIAEYGATERITSLSTIGFTMIVGTTGVTCKLKLTRDSQSYLLPIHLSDEVMLQPVFYGTLVPLLAWVTVKKLILNPLEEKKKAEKRRKQKESLREKVIAARKEAEASMNLMEERHQRILREEEDKEGLVITRCLYGLLVDQDGNLRSDLEESEDVIDITKAIQCIVETSRLVLWEGSKSSLPGVWDPCPGDSDKRILVNYTYKGAAHQLLSLEEEPIKLPKTSHKLSPAGAKLS